MELIEVKSLIWVQKGKLYITIEKKKNSRQAANSQSMGFAIYISHAQYRPHTTWCGK
jgi:glucose/arabinose dehydrogenase